MRDPLHVGCATLKPTMNISQPVVDALDWIGHELTGTPLWIQAPVVLATVVLLCAFSAFVLLRAIDMLGARMYPLFHSGQTLPHPTVALGKDD